MIGLTRYIAAGALVLIGATASATAAPHRIVIDDFAFAPRALIVAPGTTVTWTNRDEEIHTVVSADGHKAFKSPPLDTGDSFTVTFTTPGTYRYFCSIHPHMTGEVDVR